MDHREQEASSLEKARRLPKPAQDMIPAPLVALQDPTRQQSSGYR